MKKKKELENAQKQKVPQKNNRFLLNDLKLLVKSGVLIANVLPVLAGIVLALHFEDASIQNHWINMILVLLGSTLAMAGALVINNWFDVDIDSIMNRTKKRPTVTGHFTLKQVLKIGIGLSIVGFGLLLLVNWETTLYTFIGWFTYVFLYTIWSKRRYTLNTIIGSVSGAVTPLIGWATIGTAVHIVPLTLFLFLFIWQIPHTFAIAMKKCEEYRAAGVPMLPVVYGFNMTKRQMAIYISCLLPLPFLLSSLGITFLVTATILNIGWIILVFAGFKTKDDLKWAHWNFLYSVNYLTIIFLLAMITSLPFLN
ncbi:heme o synthase [Oceanobacillus halophilus]|uniref:Protoheme IX farnesyltransferase n=1 Tax=Oceanobacillus halophilus TaxID=930130 RepID=A0A495AB44_9BACI|nr:heme o synthase [Oceanobacillus halophilus]RKQ37248.1 protoheme IX farnesyltransferase [Oceanobacillus halophilus]